MSINCLAEMYCNSREISVDELCSKSRVQRIAMIRHGFVALAYSQGLLYREIADFLGMHVSTMGSCIKRHFILINDKKYIKLVKTISSYYNNNGVTDL